MQITFAGTLLADDATLLWSGADRLAASREAAADDLSGAAYRRHRDLGGAAIEFGFQVTRLHASIRAAEAHYLDHGQAVSGQGDAILSDGRRYLRDAILTARGAAIRGLTTVYEYTLIAAAVTGLVAGGLPSSSALREPALAAQEAAAIAITAIASASAIPSPAAVDQGPETIASTAIGSTATLAAPALSPQANAAIAAGPLASTSTLQSPGLVETIPSQHLATASTLHSPALAPQSAASIAQTAIASTSTLAAPVVAELVVDWLQFVDSSDVVSTPDSSENSPSGAIEFIARVSVPDWTPAANGAIVGKFAIGGTSSFSWQLRSDGLLWLFIGASVYASSNSVAGFAVDTPIWLRATFTPSATYTFEYSADTGATPPASWTSIGVSTTSGTSASVPDTSENVTLGNAASLDRPFAGKIYYAELRDGIGGTVVARFDAGDGADPTYNNVAGQTAWTNSGATPGSD